jgi:hypothetical protein
LQSGFNTAIDLNLATIPFVNLLAVLIGILVFVGLILFVMVKYVKKLGPVVLGKEHAFQSFTYDMNRENNELDNQLRMKVRLITSSLNTRLNNIFYEFRVCPVVLIALSNSVRNPLYASASNNHFTTVMLPENRESYIDGLLRAIEDEYQAVYNAIISAKCEKERYIPDWSTSEDKDKNSMRDRIRMFLMEWANDVITEIIKTCIRKIEVYEKYEPEFKHDSYRSGIIINCIAKNKNYISLLDRHGKTNWN